MNCDSVQQQLSSFFDGELSEAAATEVDAHIQACQACQAELESFEKLRLTFAVQASSAYPPPWSAVQAALSAQDRSVSLPREESVTINHERKSSRWFNDIMVIAASVAASILILAWTWQRTNGPSQVVQNNSSRSELIVAQEIQPRTQHENSMSHGHMGDEHHTHGGDVAAVVDLNETLKLHASGTDAAMQELASRYNGKAASLTEVVESFGHQPSIQSILPSSVKLVSTQLLEMPQCNCAEGECTCGPGKCNCVAAVCQRPDGSTFLVVEQCRGQDVSFGDAPTQIVKRGDHELKVGKSGDAIAVSWKAPGGRLTAFGLKSLEELDQMLATK
ncbi:MAG: zf-HC2 domain-containing protein [Aureliella sp.]